MASCDWSELPEELLGLSIARLPFPTDRARFRAVCRSWRSAMRHHAPQMQQLVVLPEGRFMLAPSADDGSHPPPLPSFPDNMSNISNDGSHPLPSFPDDDDTSCCSVIGSTNDWIALRHDDYDYDNYAYYSLHNPFSGTSMPLIPGLDAILDWDSKIRKVLMRSTPDDLIAVVTRDWDCPLILGHARKDTWLPPGPLAEVPYSFIIDVAFLGGRLYAITKAEDLMLIDVGLRGRGRRMLVRLKRLIRQPAGYRGSDTWSVAEEQGLEEEERRAERTKKKAAVGRRMKKKKARGRPRHAPDGFGLYDQGPDPRQLKGATIRYLVESRGKLLMVRHYLRIPPNQFIHPSTLAAEVFEAGVDAWVPLADGLGGGQALFVSTRFSKSVPAPPGGQIKEDAIYFVNTGEVFDMRSRTCSPVRWNMPIPCGTWVFPPQLVV